MEKQINIFGIPISSSKDELKKAYNDKYNLYNTNENISTKAKKITDHSLSDSIETYYSIIKNVGKETLVEYKNDPSIYISKEIFVIGQGKFYNYSLANHLNGMENAIIDKTGFKVNLNKSKWEKNPVLSISVKELMKEFHAKYSMTFWVNGDIRTIVVNWRYGNSFYIKGFEEYKNNIFDWKLRYSMADVCFLFNQALTTRKDGN